MLDRMLEIFREHREQHGVYGARKIAREQCIDELMVDLTVMDLPISEKVDKIITLLELMNMKVDQ